MPIPLTARSKMWIYGRSLAGILVSNTTDVCSCVLLALLYVVSYLSLRRADHTSREFVTTVVFVTTAVCLEYVREASIMIGP